MGINCEKRFNKAKRVMLHDCLVLLPWHITNGLWRITLFLIGCANDGLPQYPGLDTCVIPFDKRAGLTCTNAGHQTNTKGTFLLAGKDRYMNPWRIHRKLCWIPSSSRLGVWLMSSRNMFRGDIFSL